MEQLLISNAIDQSLDRVDFTPLQGHKVFFDTSLIDCVDKNYIVASTRGRILHAGGRLVEKAEESDVTIEIRSGGVGTDQSETFVGIPEMSMPGPMPLTIPEIKMWSRGTQTGTAKLGLVAFNTKTRDVIGSGGTIIARSDDSNSYFMGMGPWQSGSVRAEVSRQLGRPEWHPLPSAIALGPASVGGEPNKIRLADAPISLETPPAPSENPAVSPASLDQSTDSSSVETLTEPSGPAPSQDVGRTSLSPSRFSE